MADYSNFISPDQQVIKTDPNEFESFQRANAAREDRLQREKQEAQDETDQPEAEPEVQPKEQEQPKVLDTMQTVPGASALGGVGPMGAMTMPTMSPEQARQIGEAGAATVFGTVDAATDLLALTQIPWLKKLDDKWDNSKFGRNQSEGLNKVVRDISSWVIPSLTGVGLLSGLGKASGLVRVGSKVDKLSKFMAFEGLTIGFEALSDQSTEAGNLGSLIESGGQWLGMDVSIPWASREGMEPDVIRRLNILESAGLAGIASLLDGLRHVGKGVNFKPKNSLGEAAINSRAEDLIKVDLPDLELPEAVAANTANKIDLEQIRFGKKYLQKDPEGLEYNAFVNEPHEAQARGVVNFEADPVGWKVTNAQIMDNYLTTDGRHKSAYTTFFKEQYMGAKPGTEQMEKLDMIAEGIEGPKFSVTVGEKTYTPKQLEEFEDIFMENVNNMSVDEFKESLKGLQRQTDNIFGNRVSVLNRDDFNAAAGAFNRLVSELDLSRMKARAVIKNQTAGEIADVSQAIDMIGDAVDTTRQQEMVLENLKLLSQEIRTVQYLDGWRLNADKFRKSMDDKKFATWMTETGQNFDEKLLSEQQRASAFIDELVTISKKNPEFLKPLMREYARTNGDIDSIHKLTKFAENNIGILKKAVIDGNPEMPSQFLKQLQSVRYNHLLFGMAPIRAGSGATMALLGKPATMLLGATIRGDKESLSRAMFTYGGIYENLQRATQVMQRDFMDAVRNPTRSSGRTDLDDVRGLQHVETMDAMAEIWRANGEKGKVAIWNMTKGMAGYNTNPLVRFGINTMQGIDGFVRSMTASMAARTKAYDELFEANNGVVDEKLFQQKQKEIYSQAFDKDGVLTDEVAKYAAQEMNLQLDTKTIASLEKVMKDFPILRSIMMFPKTGVNALNLGMTFNPAGVIGVRMGRARRVFKAKTTEEINDVLAEHGLSGQGVAAFNALKSEYMGRELTGTAITMTALMMAFNGDLTGSGPQDQAQRQRMINAGVFKPYSIKIGGEWRSYQGLEPFDTWLGLAGDMVYKLRRADEAITEDWFNALKSTISYNFTNKTFLSGLEPLVGILNNDQGAWNKLAVGMVDSVIPGTGMRSILNKAASPGMKELENNFFEYLANRNRWLVGNELEDKLDVFNGEQINYLDPMTASINSLLPFFKTNGGTEEWRQKLMNISWDGLQRMRTNPDTGEAFTAEEITYINNFIGKEYKLGKRFESLLNAGNWEKDMEDFKAQRGIHKNSMSIDETFIHQQLNRTLNDAVRVALDSLRARDSKLANTAVLKKQVDQATRKGNYKQARKTSDQIQQLLDN